MPSTLPSLIVEVTTDKPALPTVIWFYFHISNICSNRKKKMGEISPYFVRLALLSLLIWKQILFFFQDIIHLPPTQPCSFSEKAPLSPSPERHMNSTHSEPNQANPLTAWGIWGNHRERAHQSLLQPQMLKTTHPLSCPSPPRLSG